MCVLLSVTKRKTALSTFFGDSDWTIPSIPSISFFLRRSFPFFCSESERFCFVFPLFVHNPSAFRREVPSKLPRSPPKPRNVPRSPFTLRRRSCPVAQAPFSTRGLREAEEQALPGRAWSPRSVRATSPFGLARRGKDGTGTGPVKTKGFLGKRTKLSRSIASALTTHDTQRRRRQFRGYRAARGGRPGKE